MKSLPLSVISTACLLALSACSSNNPSRYPEQVPPKPATSAKEKTLEKELEQKKTQLAEKQKEVEKLKDNEQRLQAEVKKLSAVQTELITKEQEISNKLNQIEKLSKDNKELNQEKMALAAEKQQLNAQLQQLSTEKKSLEMALIEAKPIIDKAKKEAEEKLAEQKRLADEARQAEEKRKAEEIKLAEQKRLEEEKRQSDEKRVAANKAEIAKGFINNGVDAQNISKLSGAKLQVKSGILTDQPLAQNVQDLNELVLDGKTITLFSAKAIIDRQEQYSHDTHNLDTINEQGLKGKVGTLPKRKIGDDFAQMRFGYITDEKGQTTLFVQGHQSAVDGNLTSPFNYYFGGVEGKTETLREMPKEGRFEYNGYAFYGKDNQYQELAVDALADLDNRKVKVNLKEGNQTRLVFGGTIDSNQFTGNHQGVAMKGAFYGTHGQDIGGIFYQTQGIEKDFTGVFGATKRSCGYSKCPTPEETLKEFEIMP